MTRAWGPPTLAFRGSLRHGEHCGKVRPKGPALHPRARLCPTTRGRRMPQKHHSCAACSATARQTGQAMGDVTKSTHCTTPLSAASCAQVIAIVVQHRCFVQCRGDVLSASLDATGTGLAPQRGAMRLRFHCAARPACNDLSAGVAPFFLRARHCRHERRYFYAIARADRSALPPAPGEERGAQGRALRVAVPCR